MPAIALSLSVIKRGNGKGNSPSLAQRLAQSLDGGLQLLQFLHQPILNLIYI